MIFRFWKSILHFFGLTRMEMNPEELLSRISSDLTDRDVDKFLPESLRKYRKDGSPK